jgi:hypothetical protein
MVWFYKRINLWYACLDWFYRLGFIYVSSEISFHVLSLQVVLAGQNCFHVLRVDSNWEPHVLSYVNWKSAYRFIQVAWCPAMSIYNIYTTRHTCCLMVILVMETWQHGQDEFSWTSSSIRFHTGSYRMIIYVHTGFMNFTIYQILEFHELHHMVKMSVLLGRMWSCIMQCTYINVHKSTITI